MWTRWSQALGGGFQCQDVRQWAQTEAREVQCGHWEALLYCTRITYYFQFNHSEQYYYPSVLGREGCDITTSGVTSWLLLHANGTGSMGMILRATVIGLVMCKNQAEQYGCLNFMTFNFSADYWSCSGFWGSIHHISLPQRMKISI